VPKRAQSGGERGCPHKRHKPFAKGFEIMLSKHRFPPFEKVRWNHPPAEFLAYSTEIERRSAFGQRIADDQRAFHSRLAVTRQIANEVIFSGLLEQDGLSNNLAGFHFQANI
jgi:hypothetical protein